MKMSVWSLACQQSVYFSDITVKNIYQSFTHKMALSIIIIIIIIIINTPGSIDPRG